MMTTTVNWEEAYEQFQQLQQQVEKVRQHLDFLSEQNEELDVSTNALAELAKTPLQTEILVPIADGIFCKAALADNSQLLVHVGSETTVEHSVEEVLQLLEKQQKQVSSRKTEAEEILSQLQQQAARIQDLLEATEDQNHSKMPSPSRR